MQFYIFASTDELLIGESVCVRPCSITIEYRIKGGIGWNFLIWWVYILISFIA